jgi:hypothetical protein
MPTADLVDRATLDSPHWRHTVRYLYDIDVVDMEMCKKCG